MINKTKKYSSFKDWLDNSLVAFMLIMVIFCITAYVGIYKLTQLRTYSAKSDVIERLKDSQSQSRKRSIRSLYLDEEKIDEQFIDLYSAKRYEDAQKIAEIGANLPDVSEEFVVVQWFRVYDCQLAIETKQLKDDNDIIKIQAFNNIDSIFQEILYLGSDGKYKDLIENNKYCYYLYNVAYEYYLKTYGKPFEFDNNLNL